MPPQITASEYLVCSISSRSSSSQQFETVQPLQTNTTLCTGVSNFTSDVLEVNTTEDVFTQLIPNLH